MKDETEIMLVQNSWDKAKPCRVITQSNGKISEEVIYRTESVKV